MAPKRYAKPTDLKRDYKTVDGACSRRLRGRAFRRRRAAFFSACCTAAARTVEKAVQIFSSVVVGDFLSRLDTAQCDDCDTALAPHRLRIRSAGMVDVTRHIPSRRAIDSPPAVEFEHISCAPCLAPVCFLGGNAAAAIGGDMGVSRDPLCCEQTEPGHRAANAKRARGHSLRLTANLPDVIRGHQINQPIERLPR
jgi:hypothetical protein